MREALSEAKERQIIRAHGMSCHGLKGLSGAARCDWVDIGLIRINPQGKWLVARKKRTTIRLALS